MKFIHFLIPLLFMLSACSSVTEMVIPPKQHPYIPDSVVTAKVRAALIKDPAIKNNNVSVNTYHGQVQLSGYVDSKEEVRHAARVAESIPGVLKVKNNLVVKR